MIKALSTSQLLVRLGEIRVTHCFLSTKYKIQNTSRNKSERENQTRNFLCIEYKHKIREVTKKNAKFTLVFSIMASQPPAPNIFNFQYYIILYFQYHVVSYFQYYGVSATYSNDAFNTKNSSEVSLIVC